MTWFLSYQNDLLVLNIAVTQWRYAGEIKGVEAFPTTLRGADYHLNTSHPIISDILMVVYWGSFIPKISTS